MDLFFTDVLETANSKSSLSYDSDCCLETLGYDSWDKPGDDPSRTWSVKLELFPCFFSSKTGWETQSTIKFASPAMSGAKLLCNLTLTHGLADLSVRELHKKINITYDGEFQLGFSLKHDMSKLGPVFIQLAQTPKGKEHTNYLRVCKEDKTVSVGTTYKGEDPVTNPSTYGWEATYNG